MAKRQSTEVERFWASVDKSGDCWIWKRAIRKTGYGTFRVLDPVRKMVLAHRYSYELNKGLIPDGMLVDHICHETRCVRPDHLRAVTNKQNGEHRAPRFGHGRSGVRGVFWHGALSKWAVQVRHNGKLYRGGYFSTIEEAAEDVRSLRNELYTHNDFDRTEDGR